MGTHRKTTVRCDRPKCRAHIELDESGLDVHAPLRATGWWTSGGYNPTVACPKHAPEAERLEREHHAWHVRQVEAQNAWTRENPPPKLPDWLHNTITCMH